jgi:hypothetical protein
MNHNYIFTSLTRISNLPEISFSVQPLLKKLWKTGDYVVAKVIDGFGGLLAELTSGRMITVVQDQLLVGALGVRHATLEATGSWMVANPKEPMHLLTGGGLIGKLTSKGYFIPPLVALSYQGHCMIRNTPSNMSDFAMTSDYVPYSKPTILIVGTSMTAGKTTSAKIIIHLLKKMGKTVVGAKLTGAGRYKDIMAMYDAGAEPVFDFVDVGLPSSIHEPDIFLQRLKPLLSAIQKSETDVAVVEIGASPLEPYNGQVAIDQIKKAVKFKVLCSFDPYAVYGVMKGFNFTPDLVSGLATNTLGGVELIHRLSGVSGVNLIDPTTWPVLNQMIREKLEFDS